MTSRLTPYLAFKDTAREAMTFYQSCLGGGLDLMTFKDLGDTGAAEDLVAHSFLRSEAGFELMASDTPPGLEFGARNSAVCISGDEEERLRSYWERLQEGGEVRSPLERQAWGDLYGMLVDRFGTTWMVDIGEY